VLRCANRKLVLTDVVMRTGGVSLVGVADKSLAGQHVQIVFSAGKTIATAVVGADGWFPPRRRFQRSRFAAPTAPATPPW
jgi:hypothetical protein